MIWLPLQRLHIHTTLVWHKFTKLHSNIHSNIHSKLHSNIHATCNKMEKRWRFESWSNFLEIFLLQQRIFLFENEIKSSIIIIPKDGKLTKIKEHTIAKSERGKKWEESEKSWSLKLDEDEKKANVTKRGKLQFSASFPSQRIPFNTVKSREKKTGGMCVCVHFVFERNQESRIKKVRWIIKMR